MWVFTRLSALAMYALVLFAVIGALVMGARTQMNIADLMRWGFTPNYTHVQSSDVPDLAPWSTPFWRLVAIGMLLLAYSSRRLGWLDGRALRRRQLVVQVGREPLPLVRAHEPPPLPRSAVAPR